MLACGCDPLDSCGVRGGDTLRGHGFATHRPFDRYYFLHQQRSSRREKHLLCHVQVKEKVSAAALLALPPLPGNGFRVGGRIRTGDLAKRPPLLQLFQLSHTNSGASSCETRRGATALRTGYRASAPLLVLVSPRCRESFDHRCGLYRVQAPARFWNQATPGNSVSLA